MEPAFKSGAHKLLSRIFFDLFICCIFVIISFLFFNYAQIQHRAGLQHFKSISAFRLSRVSIFGRSRYIFIGNSAKLFQAIGSCVRERTCGLFGRGCGACPRCLSRFSHRNAYGNITFFKNIIVLHNILI